MLSHSKINYQRKYSPNISDPFKLDSAEANSERRHLCESDYKVFTGKTWREVRQGREGSQARVRHQAKSHRG